MIGSWEECVTTAGTRYWRYQPPDMPRIPDSYVDSVVYLYPTVEGIAHSANMGGCGALIGVEFKTIPNLHHVYVATNAHVAETCRVVRYNTREGPQSHDLTRSRWHGHPDGWDIKVCSLRVSTFFDDRITMLSPASFLTRKQVGKIPLRHGDELFMISRYTGHPGDKDNEPIVRFGNLAKPHPVLVEGYEKREQESFLAEMRSLAGHSGSPAFLYFYGTQPRLGADTPKALTKSRILFLGLDWGHLPLRRPVYREGTKNRFPGVDVEDNSGITCIVPAWRIAEILNNDELKQERQEIEGDLAGGHPEPGIPDSEMGSPE